MDFAEVSLMLTLIENFRNYAGVDKGKSRIFLHCLDSLFYYVFAFAFECEVKDFVDGYY